MGSVIETSVSQKRNSGQARTRAPNWSKRQITRLEELCIENKTVLEAPHKDANTDKRKSMVWKHIQVSQWFQSLCQFISLCKLWFALQDEVNAVAPNCYRSLDEVKKKWSNLKSTAKAEFSGVRKSVRRTGSGTPAPLPSEASQRIIDSYETSHGFTGIPVVCAQETAMTKTPARPIATTSLSPTTRENGVRANFRK